jgi:hypothetical protein
MEDPQKQFKIVRGIKALDIFLLLLGAFASTAAFLQHQWLMFIVMGGWTAMCLYSIRTGFVKVEARLKLAEKNLYQATDADNNNTYVLASSMDEAELLIEQDKIIGTPAYIGKVKYFE